MKSENFLIRIILFFLLLVLLIVPSVLAISPQVTIFKSSCNSSETSLFSMFKHNNTHVAQLNYYNYSLCYSAIKTITLRNTTNCSSSEKGLFSQFQRNNSHVGQIGYYNYSLCMKSNDSIYIRYGSCSTGHPSLFTLFQRNNSHAGGVNYYNYTVCINDTTIPSISMDSPAEGVALIGTAQTTRYTPTDENLKNCSMSISSSGTTYIGTARTPATSGTQYSDIFTGLNFGTWTWNVECWDLGGNSKTSSATFITEPSITTGGGGGGGGITIITEEGNITYLICGDNLCSSEKGETRITCPSDCITPVFEVKWLLYLFMLLLVLFFIIAGSKEKIKKKLKDFKNRKKL